MPLLKRRPWGSERERNPSQRPRPPRPPTGRCSKYLNFNDRKDFENATRGFIGKPDTLTIKDAKGNVVWDLEAYKNFIALDKPAPDTVNPSLWRNAQLNMQYGLFKVHDRIFQVRGYDLSNITFVQGDTGWIVFDPLISAETAKAAYDLVTQHLGKRPVVAVIYSHSHVDHYGGVRGVVDEADVKAGKVQILAPEHFTEHAISENVIAGNAMSRRAIYMYGALLPRNAQGGVNGGLGQTTSTGTAGLIEPTREIKKTGEEVTIDGVRMVFQMTPGTEAPAEMNTYFPQFRAMWMAENSTNTLHNILTLRGAQVRDPLKWASYLNETIDLYGARYRREVPGHHWPMWGNAKIIDYWKKQRDLYKYMHDQSVNLMNKGYTGIEISNMVKLPPELDKQWYNRGYYGTVQAQHARGLSALHGLLRRQPDDARPVAAGGSGEEVRRVHGRRAGRSCRRPRRTSTRANTAGSRKRSSTSCSPIRTTRTARSCSPTPTSRWAIRPSPVRGARSICRARSSCATACRSAGGINTASPDTIKAMPPEMTFDYFARAAERREGGRQEDRAQHRLHRPQEAVCADGRERRAQSRQEAGRRMPTPRSR